MYTLGTTHSGLTGSGQITVTAPIGLKITTGTLPDHVSISAGTPQRFYGAGFVTPGNADGWLQHLVLDRTPQIVLPLELGLTKVGYSLNLGVSIDIQELVAAAAAPGVSMPWDRTPVAVGGSYVNDTGPHDTVTRWTYTVPAGRRLAITNAHVGVSRRSLPSALNQCGAWINAGGSRIASVLGHLPAIGSTIHGPNAGGELLIAATQDVQGFSYCTCTGGTVNFIATFSGYTFTV